MDTIYQSHYICHVLHELMLVTIGVQCVTFNFFTFIFNSKSFDFCIIVFIFLVNDHIAKIVW